MPKFLEKKLKTAAKVQGLSGRRADRYVYGALNNMGAMQGNKETEKGAEMEQKHQAKLRGEAHSYDHRRPKRPVVSRYA